MRSTPLTYLLGLLLLTAACNPSGPSGSDGGSSGTGDPQSSGDDSGPASTSSAPSTSDGSTSDASTGAAGSSGSGDGPTTGEPASDPLPLLAAGPHLGMIVGFEPPAPGTEEDIDALWNEALAAGMDVGRIQIDWRDLEPEPGVFELADLVEQLEGLEAEGLQPMLTLSTIDSLEYTIPADLLDPDLELALVDGAAFDDPMITDRFAALLDEVVPLVVDHGGFMITVGNEPDNQFSEAPEYAAEVAGFTAAARAHTATIDEEVEISMTLTYASVDTYPQSAQIIDAVDVATFNVYCQDDDGFVLPAEMFGARIDAMLEAAGDKPVVIQELGCPAGYAEDSSFGGTEALQAAYFQTVADRMADGSQLRAAFVFQMLDWSPGLAEAFGQDLLDLGFEQDVVDFFTESLTTMGLCQWEDATCRPAWDTVLTAIQEQS